jgi:hypothetical protein
MNCFDVQTVATANLSGGKGQSVFASDLEKPPTVERDAKLLAVSGSDENLITAIMFDG